MAADSVARAAGAEENGGAGRGLHLLGWEVAEDVAAGAAGDEEDGGALVSEPVETSAIANRALLPLPGRQLSKEMSYYHWHRT